MHFCKSIRILKALERSL